MKIQSYAIISGASFSPKSLENIVSGNYLIAESWEAGSYQQDIGGRVDYGSVKIFTKKSSDDWSSFSSLLNFLYKNKSNIKHLNYEDIELWIDFFHDGQCNMQIDKEELRQASEVGVVLCVSCWMQ